MEEYATEVGPPLPELVTREQLRQHLISLGFPIAFGTMHRLCSPAVNQGPPIHGYWGRHPVYRLEDGIAWARARFARMACVTGSSPRALQIVCARWSRCKWLPFKRCTHAPCDPRRWNCHLPI